LTDDSIHIWDRKSGGTLAVHRIPAEVRVVEGSRRAVAWSSAEPNVVRFATAGKEELRFWSTAQPNPVLASSPIQSLSAILGGPLVPGSQELVTQETPNGAIEMHMQNVGQAISPGQDSDTEKMVSMNGDSEKVPSTLPTTVSSKIVGSTIDLGIASSCEDVS
jgi:hypothetical protein